MVMGTLRGNKRHRLVKHRLGFLQLAVRQVGLAERAVELIYLRVLLHQACKSGMAAAGLRDAMSATSLP